MSPKIAEGLEYIGNGFGDGGVFYLTSIEGWRKLCEFDRECKKIEKEEAQKKSRMVWANRKQSGH